MSVIPFAESLGPYWVGDAPAGSLVIEFLDDDGVLGQRPDDTITATLTGPADSTATAVLTVTAEPDVEFIEVTWTTAPTFDVAGIWTLQLYPAVGARYTALRFVVQADDGWTSIEAAREDWADAPRLDSSLYEKLDAARTACLNFAPALVDGAAVPVGYRLAQLMQARAIMNATKAGTADSLGADGLTVTVFPLDWNIKALLRPKRGKPVIR